MSPQDDESSRPPRVLLAEDDPELRALLTMRLQARGCDVVPCADGLALVDELDRAVGPRRDAPLDLVLTDVRMPGVSGLSALAGLNALGRPCPVIVMTAFADEQIRKQAQRLRASALFEKPFDTDHLVKAVEDVLERQRAWLRAWQAAGYLDES